MNDDLQARAAALEARAEQAPPEAWVPQNPGDKLTGVLVRMEEGSTEYGVQDVAVIRRLDGTELAFWLLHSVAKSEWEKLEPAPGELVCIHYGGRKQPQNAEGRPYQHFRILVDRDQAAGEPTAHKPAAALEPGALPPPPPLGASDDDIPF